MNVKQRVFLMKWLNNLEKKTNKLFRSTAPGIRGFEHRLLRNWKDDDYAIILSKIRNSVENLKSDIRQGKKELEKPLQTNEKED